MESIRSQLKTLGKSEKDWKILDDKVRLDILIKAGKFGVSDETIASFTGTTDSVIQSYKTAIFDQDRGLFGFLRKIKALGDRSALDSVATFLTSWGQFTGTLSRLGSRLGLSFDPMAVFIQITDWFTGLGYAFTGMLNGGSVDAVYALFKSLGTGITDMVNNTFKGANALMRNTNWKEVGHAIGIFIGRLFGDLITKVNWYVVTEGVLRAIWSIREALIGALEGIIPGILASFKDFSIPKVSEWIYNNVPGQKDSRLESKPTTPDPPKNPVSGLSEWIYNNVPGQKDPRLESALPLPAISNPAPKTTAFAPVINLNGIESNDPQAIAQAVLDAINNQWLTYQSGSLA